MNKGFSLINKDGVQLISVDCINDTGVFYAYYSTGYGGVSAHMPGDCSMNLNIFKHTPDGPDSWRENFRIFCNAAQLPQGYKNLVAQHEVHSNISHFVTMQDCKEDFFDTASYTRGDSQVTVEAPLFVYASDCPTLLIADTVSGVYGTAHCGWKNSLNDTIKNWITAFKQAGGNTNTAIVAIGPSLCQDCFEVGEEVRVLFLDKNPGFEKHMYRKGIKTHIDLGGVNSDLLIAQGIQPQNIFVSGICNWTEYNLPSYRRDKGQNRVMGGVIYKK